MNIIKGLEKELDFSKSGNYFFNRNIERKMNVFEGKVVSITIAKKHRGSLESLGKIRAIAGKGLEGDRHILENPRGLEGQISLIEIEGN